MKAKIIEVKDLSFSYHSQFKTLENISFSIDEGEIFGFLGPNGSGKSTTQKLMIGILKKYIGNINIMGKEICDWDNEIYNHISVLFEYPYLYSNLNAYDNLNYFASFYPKSQRQDMDELLDRLDFDKNYRNKLASTYSKGMRQRLSMARALISSPKILFLDEPTSGLDPAGAVLFRKLINEERAKGMTIFLTTHNMQDAEILCDRIAFIVDGKIAAINSPKNYREKYAKDQIIIKYRKSNKIYEIMYTKTDFKNRLDKNIEQIISIHSKEPNLEDIFLKITGKELMKNG